jgi:hypothetical protein
MLLPETMCCPFPSLPCPGAHACARACAQSLLGFAHWLGAHYLLVARVLIARVRNAPRDARWQQVVFLGNYVAVQFMNDVFGFQLTDDYQNGADCVLVCSCVRGVDVCGRDVRVRRSGCGCAPEQSGCGCG